MAGARPVRPDFRARHVAQEPDEADREDPDDQRGSDRDQDRDVGWLEACLIDARPAPQIPTRADQHGEDDGQHEHRGHDSHDRDAGRVGEELRRRQAECDRAEPGAEPGEEGALIGEVGPRPKSGSAAPPLRGAPAWATAHDRRGRLSSSPRAALRASAVRTRRRPVRWHRRPGRSASVPTAAVGRRSGCGLGCPSPRQVAPRSVDCPCSDDEPRAQGARCQETTAGQRGRPPSAPSATDRGRGPSSSRRVGPGSVA
jgi:hypothetical protein